MLAIGLLVWRLQPTCGYRKFYPRIERRESGYFRDPQIGYPGPWLRRFRHALVRLWLGTLRRRSGKSRCQWPRIRRLADRWLPYPSILHPYPDQRLAVRTRGRSPVR
jgi:hypothetical protein